MATIEDLESTFQRLQARVAAIEASQADMSKLAAAIEGFGDTQQMLADVLRDFGGGMRTLADDTNGRIRALEKATLEIKDLLVRSLEGSPGRAASPTAAGIE